MDKTVALMCFYKAKKVVKVRLEISLLMQS